MSSINLVKTTPVVRTVRVMQLEGLFAVPPSERSDETWTVDLTLPNVWNVGLIVGPSGSGKTTVARELFSDHLIDRWDWPADKSVLDGFPSDMSIKEIVELLSSVGFSSPPSWVRPFRVLSNGEQFRVSIARTLAERRDLAVVDEFTSVVDRTVAKIGSAAIQKTVRRRGQKFIAVSCHYDIAEWLEPDWIYEPHTNVMTVGRTLRRPEIELEVRRVHHSAWRLFAKHHYLDRGLSTSAYCFVGFVTAAGSCFRTGSRGEAVAFCAVMSFPHAKRPGWRVTRLVTLPDYQGIGIGGRVNDFIASAFKSTGRPVFITTSHPSMVGSLNRSKLWRVSRNSSFTSPVSSGVRGMTRTTAVDRLTFGFEYVGVSMDKKQAELLLNRGEINGRTTQDTD